MFSPSDLRSRQEPNALLDERFTLRWCSSLRTTSAHRPPAQFSVVLVAATGDFLDRVQHVRAACQLVLSARP